MNQRHKGKITDEQTVSIKPVPAISLGDAVGIESKTVAKVGANGILTQSAQPIIRVSILL